MSIEAMKQALEALRDLLDQAEPPPDKNCSCHIAPPCSDCVNYSGLRYAIKQANDSITSLRQAIAELEIQEPVAWRAPNWSNLHGEYGYRDFDDPVCGIDGKPSPNNEPLYTHPPQRPRIVFPTMLRKMWSGGEVQAWLDENVNKENT